MNPCLGFCGVPHLCSILFKGMNIAFLSIYIIMVRYNCGVQELGGLEKKEIFDSELYDVAVFLWVWHCALRCGCIVSVNKRQ